MKINKTYSLMKKLIAGLLLLPLLSSGEELGTIISTNDVITPADLAITNDVFSTGLGGFTNTVLRMSTNGWHWYDSPYTAFDDAVDNDVFYIYPGDYSEQSRQLTSWVDYNVPRSTNVSVIGIGNPWINVEITDNTYTEAGFSIQWGSRDFTMDGVNFLFSSAGTNSGDFRYGAVFSASTNVLINDCILQWNNNSTGDFSSKVLVSVAFDPFQYTRSENFRMIGGAILAYDTNDVNGFTYAALHDSTNAVFQDVFFGGIGVDVPLIYAPSTPVFIDCTEYSDGQWLADTFDVARLNANALDRFTKGGIETVTKVFPSESGESFNNYHLSLSSGDGNKVFLGNDLDNIMGSQGSIPSLCVPPSYTGTVYMLPGYTNSAVTTDELFQYWTGGDVEFVGLGKNDIYADTVDAAFGFWNCTNVNVKLRNISFRNASRTGNAVLFSSGFNNVGCRCVLEDCTFRFDVASAITKPTWGSVGFYISIYGGWVASYGTNVVVSDDFASTYDNVLFSTNSEPGDPISLWVETTVDTSP